MKRTLVARNCHLIHKMMTSRRLLKLQQETFFYQVTCIRHSRLSMQAGLRLMCINRLSSNCPTISIMSVPAELDPVNAMVNALHMSHARAHNEPSSRCLA